MNHPIPQPRNPPRKFLIEFVISRNRGAIVDLDLDTVAVTHNEQAHRFEATVNGLRSLLTYRRSPDHIVLMHTEVPAPIEGRGIAAKLTRTALDFARAHHLRVVPSCPYVSSFLRQHREYHDLLSADDVHKILSTETV